MNIVANKMIVLGSSCNAYWYNLENVNSLEDLFNICQSAPEILNFDGKLSALYFPKNKNGVQGVISTTAGTTWYVDWSERVSIILTSWHNTFKKTTDLCFNQTLNKIVTASTDFSVKVWNCSKNSHFEEEVDFFIANKICLCMDSLKNTLVAGFNDGTVRVYELHNNVL